VQWNILPWEVRNPLMMPPNDWRKKCLGIPVRTNWTIAEKVRRKFRQLCILQKLINNENKFRIIYIAFLKEYY